EQTSSLGDARGGARARVTSAHYPRDEESEPAGEAGFRSTRRTGRVAGHSDSTSGGDDAETATSVIRSRERGNRLAGADRDRIGFRPSQPFDLAEAGERRQDRLGQARQ